MSVHEHPSNPDLDGIKLAQVWNITYHFYLFCLRQDKSVCLYVYKMIEDSKSGSRKNRVFSQSGKRLERRMVFMISYTNNLSRIVGHVYQKRCSKFVVLFTINARVSHSGGHGGDTPPPSYDFFSKTPPTKTDAPHMEHPPLLNDPPIWKTKPPPSLKHETPFHEMLPRKSTINNNLKSS